MNLQEVSALPFGSLPYEEYFPCEAELAHLEKQEPALFETYRELMCHLYICSSIHGGNKGTSCSLKSWGNYLFPDMENVPEAARCGVADEDIFDRMQKHLGECPRLYLAFPFLSDRLVFALCIT